MVHIGNDPYFINRTNSFTSTFESNKKYKWTGIASLYPRRLTLQTGDAVAKWRRHQSGMGSVACSRDHFDCVYFEKIVTPFFCKNDTFFKK